MKVVPYPGHLALLLFLQHPLEGRVVLDKILKFGPYNHIQPIYLTPRGTYTKILFVAYALSISYLDHN
jgi:hypothetical protein